MSVCYATPMYGRCRCNLDGKIRGKKCPDCGGFGVLLEELPPQPEHTKRGQRELFHVMTAQSEGVQHGNR